MCSTCPKYEGKMRKLLSLPNPFLSALPSVSVGDTGMSLKIIKYSVIVGRQNNVFCLSLYPHSRTHCKFYSDIAIKLHLSYILCKSVWAFFESFPEQRRDRIGSHLSVSAVYQSNIVKPDTSQWHGRPFSCLSLHLQHSIVFMLCSHTARCSYLD